MTAERNRALRIAYNHARRGSESLAATWLAIAGNLAAVRPDQLAHLDELLAANCGVHPDQLRLVGAVQVGEQATTEDV